MQAVTDKIKIEVTAKERQLFMRDERTPAGLDEQVKLEEVLELANSIALGHYSQVFADQL